MADQWTEFERESEEYVSELNNALVRLERTPTDEVIDRTFRAAHTLKSNCGAMGLSRASDLAHTLEDVLAAIRSESLDVTPAVMDATFEGVDVLETMIGEAGVRGECETDPAETIESLRSLLGQPGSDEPAGDVPPLSVERIERLVDGQETVRFANHAVYAVRVAVEPVKAGGERKHVQEVNDGTEGAILDALDDAFDLLATEPSRAAVERGEHDGWFDVAFSCAVAEPSIVAAFEGFDGVAAFELVPIADSDGRTDRLQSDDNVSGPGSKPIVDTDSVPPAPHASRTDPDSSPANSEGQQRDSPTTEGQQRDGPTTEGQQRDDPTTEGQQRDGQTEESTQSANQQPAYHDLSVDDLLETVDEFDDLDDLAGGFDEDELEPFEDMGAAGTFDELLPAEAPRGPRSDGPPDIESTTDRDSETTEETSPDQSGETETVESADDDVSDASAVFEELKSEVEMVGFDELTDEIEALEFEGVEGDEIGMDELLGDDLDADWSDSGVEDIHADVDSEKDDDSCESTAGESAVGESSGGESAGVELCGDESAGVELCGGESNESLGSKPDESGVSIEFNEVSERKIDWTGGGADQSIGPTDSSVAADSKRDGDSTWESEMDESTDTDDGRTGNAAASSADSNEPASKARLPVEPETLEWDDESGDDARSVDSVTGGGVENDSATTETNDTTGIAGRMENSNGRTEDSNGRTEHSNGRTVDSVESIEDTTEAKEITEAEEPATTAGFATDRLVAVDETDNSDTTAVGGADGTVTRIAEPYPEMEIPDISIPEPPARDRSVSRDGDGPSVRVDAAQIDTLLTLVEGLVTSRVRLRHAIETGADARTVGRELDGLDELSADIRETVTEVRLLPFETVTDRLPRIVRDVARERDKEVTFELAGGDVELDRGILDRIREPLVHLVRNAVDHGIEPPDEREAAGKPRCGTVTVRAERARDRIRIEVEDDGRGLDTAAIRAAAAEEGVCDDPSALSDDDVFDVMFSPGVSTARTVTDVSGRGVGMDVVDRVVADLDGSVSIDSAPGEGTAVTMTVPISVAVDDVLFLECIGQPFGIPSNVVEDVATVDFRTGLGADWESAEGRTKTDDASRTDDARDDSSRTDGARDDASRTDDSSRTDSEDPSHVIDLADALDLVGADSEQSEGEALQSEGDTGQSAVDGGQSEGETGQSAVDGGQSEGDGGSFVRIRPSIRSVSLRCDAVTDQQTVVVTPFEGFLRDVPGVSGATVRGRGEIVPILDVNTL